jgi:hypothetical protein
MKFYLDPLVEGNREILIHEHNYSADRINWLEKSGRFNVGFVAGRNVNEFRRCLSKWRYQVIEDSSINYDKGICGDQKYLDNWPLLYNGLHISEEIGAGVAPWNLNNYTISWNGSMPFIDNERLIFYHFHGLQTLKWKFFIFYLIAPGYNIKLRKIKRLYITYLNNVTRVSANIGIEKSHKSFFDFFLSSFKSRLLPNILLQIDRVNHE